MFDYPKRQAVAANGLAAGQRRLEEFSISGLSLLPRACAV
jgi:hypothetical protein